ncbi:hypothetical protein Plhal304r1_c057g0143731 [Plasmopara halstedii]
MYSIDRVSVGLSMDCIGMRYGVNEHEPYYGVRTLLQFCTEGRGIRTNETIKLCNAEVR